MLYYFIIMVILMGKHINQKNPEKTLHQSEKTICMSQSVKK